MQGRVYYAYVEWIALPASGEPGLAFVQAMYSYTRPLPNGSTKRLASLLTMISNLHYDPAAKHSRSQGEGGNPLTQRAAGETTPALGCSCLPPVVASRCRLASVPGVLALLELQAPILHPQDHPLEGSCLG